MAGLLQDTEGYAWAGGLAEGIKSGLLAYTDAQEFAQRKQLQQLQIDKQRREIIMNEEANKFQKAMNAPLIQRDAKGEITGLTPLGQQAAEAKAYSAQLPFFEAGAKIEPGKGLIVDKTSPKYMQLQQDAVYRNAQTVKALQDAANSIQDQINKGQTTEQQREKMFLDANKDLIPRYGIKMISLPNGNIGYERVKTIGGEPWKGSEFFKAEQESEKNAADQKHQRTMEQQGWARISADKAEKGKISDQNINQMNNYDEALNQAKAVLERFDPSFVGIATGRVPGDVLSIGAKFGLLNSEKVAKEKDFRSTQEQMANAYRKLITGAGGGEREIQKIIGSLPLLTENPEEYKKKLLTFINNMEGNRENYLSLLEKSGKKVEQYKKEKTKGLIDKVPVIKTKDIEW